MAGDLLQTKLYVPRLRPSLIPRPHLIKKLNQGLQQGCKLTLISASAGFGKTTLVSSWIDDLQVNPESQEKTFNHQSRIVNSVAWLSLDEGDNDLPRFLAYFVAALQTVAGNIGEGVMGMLQSPQLPPIDSILTTLLNEIATIPDDLLLILDDYHLIDSQPIDHALTLFLEHMPPQMHLVIATREDPNLPLARLRVRGQLTELRATDLRFSNAEAAGFLNEVMGLNLSEAEVAALETRTEGWIAGLQMAALAVQERTDTTSFIQAFTGSHRFVMDYLAEEILQQQPEHVRGFLLETAILDRLSGPLCNAVTGQDDGKAMLEALERDNLFIVPLDDQRQWYRYHHLFADVLQTHLLEAQPDQISSLHQRASAWYEENGSPSDAVRHALAAKDLQRVASLAELAWQAMDSSFQFATWLGWVQALPDELLRTRPVLAVQIAMSLSDTGEVEASESRLRDAERWLDRPGDATTQPEKMVVVDEDQFRTLSARIAIIRAGNAQAQGDLTGTVKYAELALKLTPEEEHLLRAQATINLGFIHWANGDLAAAQRFIADWIDSMQQMGYTVFAIASSFVLAELMVAQGQLHQAVKTYQQSLQLASEHDQHVQGVIAHLHLGLALLLHEMGKQEAAEQQLQKAKASGKNSVFIDWPHRWHLAQAHFKEASGDLTAALDLLDEAKRLYVRNPIPMIHPIEALKARIYIKRGRLSSAQDWAHEQNLAADDSLSYLKEFEHITFARLLIAQRQNSQANHTMSEALGLLARLLKAAEAGKRTGSIIEILVLQALAYQAEGSLPLALELLERALTLGEEAGYVRLFANEGTPLAKLLREAAAYSVMPDYVGKLSAAFEAGEQANRDKSHPFTSPPSQPLIEPLSQRELDVLRLLKTELSGPEISRELVVALSTVRTHTKSIYSKLNVNSRRTAVKRATELDLI